MSKRDARKGPQPELPLKARFTHGGARPGAGRPRKADAGVPHAARRPLSRHHPVHLTFRMRAEVWNLRARRTFRPIQAALAGVHDRPGFRVVHFSVQGNHLHAIVEAADRVTLSSGAKAFAIRIAKGLNRVMRRRGPVFADRHHARPLRTPAEVRNAVQYVVGNAASHAARAGRPVAGAWVDPFCSAAADAAPLVNGPTTWLLVKSTSR